MCTPHPGHTHDADITSYSVKVCADYLENTISTGGAAPDAHECCAYIRKAADMLPAGTQEPAP